MVCVSAQVKTPGSLVSAASPVLRWLVVCSEGQAADNARARTGAHPCEIVVRDLRFSCKVLLRRHPTPGDRDRTVCVNTLMILHAAHTQYNIRGLTSMRRSADYDTPAGGPPALETRVRRAHSTLSLSLSLLYRPCSASIPYLFERVPALSV